MRILAVDDEPDNLTRLVKEIKNVISCVDIGEFTDADDALEFARQGETDIAFLDIELGIMSGVELAKKIKELHPYTNIVFCTGYAEYMPEAFHICASDYLMKPITAEKIRHATESLRHPPEFKIPKGVLFARCFGKFEIFLNNTPLTVFPKRSKELLAYLVYKQGAMCTTKEIMDVIFVDLSESYFRVARKELEDGLYELGLSDVLVKKWGKLGIDVSKIVCDKYEYDKGNPEAVNLNRGIFMEQYSWAES